MSYRAYKKFLNIDPLNFDEYEGRKGCISFLSVADTLAELSVSASVARLKVGLIVCAIVS